MKLKLQSRMHRKDATINCYAHWTINTHKYRHTPNTNICWTKIINFVEMILHENFKPKEDDRTTYWFKLLMMMMSNTFVQEITGEWSFLLDVNVKFNSNNNKKLCMHLVFISFFVIIELRYKDRKTGSNIPFAKVTKIIKNKMIINKVNELTTSSVKFSISTVNLLMKLFQDFNKLVRWVRYYSMLQS